MRKKEVEPSAALMKALRDLEAVPVASRVVIHEEREALREQNAAPKRTVEDLAHVLRNLNRIFEERDQPRTASAIRTTLERHGLLRDVDRPEMVSVFKDPL